MLNALHRASECIRVVKIKGLAQSYFWCKNIDLQYDVCYTGHLTTSKRPPMKCCKSCPGLNVIRDHLKIIFEDNQITNVQFEKWFGTYRFTISTQLLPFDDFIDSLCHASNKLKQDKIIVQCNFAEHYNLVVQEVAQIFHWNHRQATLLTSVFYYKNKSEIEHSSILMI
ncbi:hypothetical protein RN001_004730 [Aquatica leii]|uniref:Uncharacterized protein n=1 Tax=Aquatica leii TaxID=1421715 RepID=A0AAN7PF07_9COLE|nr:hypothetical protein RN001_004730 [Aquatica leii]